MLLALDTSSLSVSVALLAYDMEGVGELVAYQDHFEPTHQQSKRIFGLIDNLLVSQNRNIDEIQALAVGVGPGSYTGIRVGLSLIKTWAFAKDLPVFRFSSQVVLQRGSSDVGETLSLKNLRAEDLVRLGPTESLVPVYEKDHFA